MLVRHQHVEKLALKRRPDGCFLVGPGDDDDGLAHAMLAFTDGPTWNDRVIRPRPIMAGL
jgi:hypothetical protein